MNTSTADTTLSMDKGEVQALIKAKSPRLTFCENTGKIKSDVWLNFVFIKVDEVLINYIKCTACDSVLKWKSRDGTTGLRAHRESCMKSPISGMGKFGATGERKYKTKTQIPDQVKAELADAIAEMCAKDLLPYDLVQGKGFRELVQKLIELGAKYKKTSFDDVLPSGTELALHVSDVMEAQKYNIIAQICAIQTLGVTLDTFRSSRSQDQQFLSVSIHILDASWKLQSFCLLTCLIDESFSPEYIYDIVTNVLHQYSAYRDKSYYITDKILALQAAFPDCSIECACHNLELTVSQVLQESNTELPYEVHHLIRTCTELVSQIIQNNLSKQFGISVYNSNSSLSALKNVAESLLGFDITGFRADNAEYLMRLLGEVDTNLLREIVSVLERFQKAAALLTSEDSPTLQLVIPVRNQLSEHLNPSNNDSDILQTVKFLLKQQLSVSFTVSDIHYAAALMDPRLKSRCSLLSLEERGRALSLLRSMVADVSLDTTQEPVGSAYEVKSNASTIEDECCSSTSKRIKISQDGAAPSDDFFGDLFTEKPVSSVKSDNEVDQYINSTETCTDIVTYWMDKSHKWLNLSYVVRCVLGISASNSFCGRWFCLQDRCQVEDRLNHLDVDSVHSLLFLRGVKDYLNTNK